MPNKFTIGGRKEAPKLETEDLLPKPTAQNSLPPPGKLGFVPSKPQFSGLSKEALNSLGSGRRDERALGRSTAGGGLLRLQTEKEAAELSTRSQAGRALFSAHTVGSPGTSYAAARQKLEAFFEEAKNFSPAQLSEVVAGRPDLLDAALDFLAYRFTPVGFAEVGRDPDAKKPTQVALRLVQEMDEPRRLRFLEAIVFNVAHPANHQALWPAIVASVSPDRLEQALLDKASSNNELHALNAFSLPFEVYGRKPGYDLSELARTQLTQWAETKKVDPSTNLLLRQSLEGFALPANL